MGQTTLVDHTNANACCWYLGSTPSMKYYGSLTNGMGGEIQIDQYNASSTKAGLVQSLCSTRVYEL